MDMVLVVVAALAIAMAIAMGVVVVGLVREDRRRSGARVAALMEMAGDGGNVRPTPEATSAAPPKRRPAVRDAGDLELRRPETTVAGVSELFAAPPAPSPWPSRFAVVAVLAAIVSGAGYGLMRVGERGPDLQAGRVARTAAAAAVAAPPLELLSLKHAQRADAIVVSGLVQNPAAGARMERIVVTALALGEDGAILASGRAPLDFTSLAPGDESPFLVTVPVNGRVARYRIGFRTEDGGIIGHVDKRHADAVALK